jgi:hypothetical protein
MKSTILNQITFLDGSAMSPTVDLYQRSSGRCRLWWYCWDQGGMEFETIATFKERDWEKAVERGWELYRKFRGWA